jgi:glucosamine--fructose-6-phosphate aminotransferase (isomerizing)
MCGIVAVLPRPASRAAPAPAEILAALNEVERVLGSGDLGNGDIDPLRRALDRLTATDRSLRYTPGLSCLLGTEGLIDDISAVTSRIGKLLSGIESWLDGSAQDLAPAVQEELNAVLIALKDAWWAIDRDRLDTARAVRDLTSESFPGSLIAQNLVGQNLSGWWAIEVALSSIDRLEVRGRDSAGVHVLVAGHGLDLDDPAVLERIAPRAADPLFTAGAVRIHDGCLSFVYKAAAEIGELGDNIRALRAQIRCDTLLAAAISAETARVTVLGHTRWASVGIISEPNAHPVNSDELGRPGSPYLVAALNGDVDNHAELRASESLATPGELTTDAKVIPTLVSRRIADGAGVDQAFVDTVQRFEGSVAIAASAAVSPDSIMLALNGSGQSLNVGLAEDAFVVASEAYGLVEETDHYLRMDGESTRGQVVVIDRGGAGTLAGVNRYRYDGTPLPVGVDEIVKAEITTRDVDRGGYQHFLLKELTEAPASFRKTLRGRISSGDGGSLTVRVGPETLPPALASALAECRIERVVVIGQGTAAVAGQAVAAAISICLPEMTVIAQPATELSGFGLRDDMSDTLVVAISQSGTTTDTNRTVDLVRARGAHVVAVVNRRNSDLSTKAQGVLYTSDGRDVEMSVASTKAFYAQVAAGWLLAGALAQASGRCHGEIGERLQAVLSSLRDLPGAMEQVLSSREEIGRLASSIAPARRYWAVVGSGPDRIAASEVRIKLSELCYRSISSDATEDKKHIDLSCEPLILVCAAGLYGPNADDVAKEVAIYKAHNAAPVVVVPEAEAERFRKVAGDVITVPATNAELAFVLSAMVGHLFGYEAALSIDAQARPLRAARAVIEHAAANGEDGVLERLRHDLESATQPFLQGLRDGSYNGNLEASTAVRLVSLLRYATGVLPLDAYEHETGKIGTPEALLSDLLDALNAGIDELTRPVDAIKHQAKTVTVGISRSEEVLFGFPLVKATLGAGATADMLGYRALRTLGALDEAIDEVTGYTRYRIEWSAPGGPAASVVDQGGQAANLPSRTRTDPRLRGSKHRAAEEREVTVVRGASDGRTVVLVPEVKGSQVTGMTLLHARFKDKLDSAAAKRVLSGYRTRYSALKDAVTETEPSFDDSRLGEVPIVDLLTEPVYALATRWRSGAR